MKFKIIDSALDIIQVSANSYYEMRAKYPNAYCLKLNATDLSIRGLMMRKDIETLVKSQFSKTEQNILPTIRRAI